MYNVKNIFLKYNKKHQITEKNEKLQYFITVYGLLVNMVIKMLIKQSYYFIIYTIPNGTKIGFSFIFILHKMQFLLSFNFGLKNDLDYNEIYSIAPFIYSHL